MDTAAALQLVTGVLLGVVAWFVKGMSVKIDELSKILATNQVTTARLEARDDALDVRAAALDVRVTKLEAKE